MRIYYYPLEIKISSINLEIGLPVLFLSLLSLFIVSTDKVRLMRFLWNGSSIVSSYFASASNRSLFSFNILLICVCFIFILRIEEI